MLRVRDVGAVGRGVQYEQSAALDEPRVEELYAFI